MLFDLGRTTRRILRMVALIGGSLLADHPLVLASDTIHFKDGMRTVCEGSVREQDDELHCDYDGGLLIYPKADVARIERGRSPAEPQQESKPAAAPGPDRLDPALPVPAADLEVVPSRGTQNAPGSVFYDPRRPRKYWSSETRHHETLREAISALAQEFDRPEAWIEENLGDSNDLGAVRERLASRLQEPVAAQDPPPSAQGAAVEFYNPRRVHKYMTGPDAAHATFQEALAALAQDFDKPVDWVERNMGTTNDVHQIRQNLKNAQTTETGR
jgi:hypothetical protein